MKRISFLSVLLLVIISFGTSRAIEFVVEMSPGSTFYHPTLGGTYYKANTDVYMDLKMANNDGFDQTGYSQSHRFFARVDGVETDGIPVNWLDAGGDPGGNGPVVRMNGWEDASIWPLFNELTFASWDGSLPDSMNHTTAAINGWLATDNSLETRFRFYFNFPLGGSNVAEFCIDSSNWNNSTWDWLFTTVQNFGGPYCFEFAAVPDLIVDKDFLGFSATKDDPLPGGQFVVLQNNSSMESLSWSASKKTSWLSVTPSSGVLGASPVSLQVGILTTSMPPAIYYDTITITAPDAGNSPIKIPVEYEIVGNPPIIEISPTNFIFNAVAGLGNPSDQILTISNIGFSDLNWTVSNTESWLSLSPGSGINNGSVTLSVDITGLSFGIYNDVIMVEDPEADNSPQMAYVQLEIASDLPVIEIDSTFIFVIANEDYPPDRKFKIMNGGAGTMNYYLYEDALDIVGLNPNSGSVPQEVTVSFKTLGPPGWDLFDTVWVYSDEAVNSPQFVEFQFHFTDDPAVIGVDKSFISAEYYECGQGSNAPGAGPISLNVINITAGFHEPFSFQIEPTEDWLDLSAYSGPAPATITYDFEYRGLAPGIYEDTIHISAINAINSPVLIPVEMTILESSETPQIVTSAQNIDIMKFAARINQYGVDYWFQVNDLNPGCMDWDFSYLPSWLAVEPIPETTYPWEMNFKPSGHGIARGVYSDEIIIESPQASNSPHSIAAELSVWEFYGDTNFDGIINILDIVRLVNYLYKNGPRPLPVTIVGDCDCNSVINVLDVIRIVNYLYKDFVPICGNPYK